MEIDDSDEAASFITEGKASVIGEGHVFYNPVQQFNRDLSTLVLSAYFELTQLETLEKLRKKSNGANAEETQEIEAPKAGQKFEGGLRILEALSATGLRSIRYAKEIPGIEQITANDLSRQAVEAIKLNLKNNDVEHLVTPENMDATQLMYSSIGPKKRFSAIDLDPYGCPSIFLPGAVQSVEDGGLLLITATDMAVLAGNTPESCYLKYGTMPLKSKACHEMALRILLKCIESHANLYGRYIQPLLSVSVDFYIRVFVRVFTNPQECKKSTSKISYVYQCTGCNALTFHPLGILKPNPTDRNPKQIKYAVQTGPPVNKKCEFCNFRHHLGGPIWTAPIHDQNFVVSLLKNLESDQFSYLGTNKRITGILNVIQEELPDIPLYYTIESICSTLKLETVPILKFRSALLHENYRISFSHASKSSIKTDAPMSVIWDVLRAWGKTHPVKKDRFIEGTPLNAILSVECSKEYKFHDIHPLANPPSRKFGFTRFAVNPTSHWGPGTRGTL